MGKVVDLAFFTRILPQVNRVDPIPNPPFGLGTGLVLTCRDCLASWDNSLMEDGGGLADLSFLFSGLG